MENDASNDKLNLKALLITVAVLLLIPVVYVLFIKKDAPAEIQPAAVTAVAQTPAPVNNIDNLKQTAETTPTELNYINLSLAYFYAKQYNECIAASRKAIAINPKSALAYNNICSAYNCLSVWDSAIVAGQAAVRINPDLQLAKNNLGWAIQMKQKGN